ncbi:hypothetical protein JTE90_000482 [Oedothorax gibbosus]|uniref:Uncharacterized protein n=1 Tax=Oedothorax gibbosus TaxID=931172 RepID=A0AAV6TZG9_9ARAC|nr:hypothetical protein JTE90_000482 [Oedothorax gibbosus]
MDETDVNAQWLAWCSKVQSGQFMAAEDHDKLAEFLRIHVLPNLPPDDEPQAVAVEPVPDPPPMETDTEPQAVANIPVSNQFQALAESIELPSDAQFPSAGTATPDAPFPEVCSDARSQEGSTDGPTAKKIKLNPDAQFPEAVDDKTPDAPSPAAPKPNPILFLGGEIDSTKYLFYPIPFLLPQKSKVSKEEEKTAESAEVINPYLLTRGQRMCQPLEISGVNASHREIISVLCTVISFLTLCNSEVTDDGNCFCKLEGRIDDCSCNIDTVDHFNNVRLYPVLNSILVTDFFRYIKLNLNRGCPFWPDDSKCALQDCSVKTCPEEQLPRGLKGNQDFKPQSIKHDKDSSENETCDENNGGLGAVNETISDENYEGFQRWQQHDDTIDTFCEMDDESSAEVQYVDLLLNPERYTGYKGSSAHRIWNSIYKENCFRFSGGYGPYTTSKNLNDMCLEKRAFYRAVSGVHSSISIHLSAEHYTKAKDCFSKGKWGMNIAEFQRRFDPSLTDGEGPHWLKNLYFVYLLELRAIAKAGSYLENELFYTGNDENDEEVRTAVKKLVEIARSFPDHFNEKVMFSGNDKEARKLKEEFRLHFLNVSRIMDCVGCDKCRLWGKIQVQGLGTAFKILFSKDLPTHFSMNRKHFRLTRTEVVSLFNAFGRLSNSVRHIEQFRHLLGKNIDKKIKEEL